MTKKSAKKPAKKAAAKKTTEKKPVKDIKKLFPNMLSVTELEEETNSKKTGKAKDLNAKDIKTLKNQLGICEAQIASHEGTPIEEHYQKMKQNIMQQLKDAE